MPNWIADVRYGLRSLLRHRIFSVTAIITLALGIGVNAAVFSLMTSIFLRPLQVEEPEQIVALFTLGRGAGMAPVFSQPEIRDLREQTTDVFAGVSGFQYAQDGMSMDGLVTRMLTSYVTGDFFPLMGVQPAAGRLISGEEGVAMGADPVLVLGHRFWQRELAGDPDVVGRKVLLNGHPFTVIGVVPEGFQGFSLFDSIEAYLPINMFGLGSGTDFSQIRAFRIWAARARLLPGVTLEQANEQLALVAERLAREYPEDSKDLRIVALPEFRARFGTPQTTDNMFAASRLFLGLAALVLVLACVNVGSLLLVRATVREQEMALRSALGAGRLRLIAQFMAESAILAIAGGLAGVVLGRWCSALLARVDLNSDFPYNFDFSFDWRVFSFAFAAALVAALVVGLVPAIRSSRGNSGALRDGGRGMVGGKKQRLRSALVTVQVIGSFTLLVISGLFIRSLEQARSMDLGFEPAQVVNLSMDPKQIGYGEPEGRTFFRDLLARVRALPNVVSAATAFSVPMGYFTPTGSPLIDDYVPQAGEAAPRTGVNVVSVDYFATMGVDLLDGRVFVEGDGGEAPRVAIVNRTMAERFWPGSSAVGKTFRRAQAPDTPVEIIGVVDDVRYAATETVDACFYLPFAQVYAPFTTLHVRVAGGDPAALAPKVREVISSLAPSLPVYDVMTMEDGLYTARGLLIFQIGAALTAVLGGLGLVLSIIGLYGVISYSVALRTQEMGVRLALGATSRDIVWLVFRHGLVIVALGVAIGWLTAIAASRAASRFLIVSTTDPLTYGVVAAILVVVALLACYLPALRGMAAGRKYGIRSLFNI